MGVPQAKPMHVFSPDFQDMFTQTRSRVDSEVLGVYLATCVAMEIHLRLLGLKFVDVSVLNILI